MDAELATSLRGPSPFLDDLRKGAFYLSLSFSFIPGNGAGKWRAKLVNALPSFFPFPIKVRVAQPLSFSTFGVCIVHGLIGT